MKYIFVGCFLLFLCINLSGQSPFTVQCSPQPNAPITDYSPQDDKYFVDDQDICIVNAKGYIKKVKDLFVARYDKNTLEFKSYSYIFPKKSLDKAFMEMWYIKILTLKGKHYLLINDIDRKSKSIIYYYILLDSHFNPVGQPTMYLEISHEKGFGTSSIYENPEQNGFLILFNNTTAKGDEKGKLFHKFFDADFNMVSEGYINMWTKTDILGWTSDVDAVNNFRYLPANILYYQSPEYDHTNYETKKNFSVTMGDVNTGENLTTEVDMVENPLCVCFYADETDINVFGYYRTGKNQGADGLYSIIISRSDMTIKEKNAQEFDSDLVSQLFYTKTKNTEYAVTKAKMSDIFRTSDRGYYIIGNQYDSYSYQSDNNWTITVHTLGNIIVSKLDSNTNLEWTSTIPRRVVSKYPPYIDVQVEMVNDELIFLYNDDAANLDATHVNDLKVVSTRADENTFQLIGAVMDEKGNFKKYKLADWNEYGLAFIPKHFVNWNYDGTAWLGKFTSKDSKEIRLMKVGYTP